MQQLAMSVLCRHHLHTQEHVYRSHLSTMIPISATESEWMYLMTIKLIIVRIYVALLPANLASRQEQTNCEAIKPARLSESAK